MRRFLVLPLAALLTVALAAPVAAGRDVVSVKADAGWVSTGIAFTGGQELPVQTLGFVTTAPIPAFLQPGSFISGSGPAGQTSGLTCGEVTGAPPWVGECALGEAYFGELIGRVGSTAFRVGDTTAIVVPEGVSGELELAVNDFANTYGDNHGPFTILFR